MAEPGFLIWVAWVFMSSSGKTELKPVGLAPSHASTPWLATRLRLAASQGRLGL